jgi:hypothetical protein
MSSDAIANPAPAGNDRFAAFAMLRSHLECDAFFGR